MKGLREADARYTETAVSAAEKAVDETERGLSLSYARTLSWCSLAVVLLTSLALSFFISNSARQTLMQRQEEFATLLAKNLNNQIFQRFAVPTILEYGRIALRQEQQYQRLDSVVKSVIEGLPVDRLRVYDFSHVVAYSTDAGEIGKKGIAPLGLEKVLGGVTPKPVIHSQFPLWQVPFRLPLDPGVFQLRVLFPLRGDSYRIGSQSPVLGVLELTQDITSDYVQVLVFQCIIVVMCLLSSAILFALLLVIIHRAERVLTERMQKNRQLEKEIQSTERLVSMGRVVASIAHEIRNPLGIIRSTAELLQRRADKVDKGTVRLLQAIYDESVRLSQTVNDFLDYARPRQPRQDPVELELVIDQILAFVEGEFGRSGVGLKKNFEEDLWVLGDKDLLYRAFYNVLANAQQALDMGGTIDIHVFRRDDRAVLDFTDSGKGFDPETLPHLLEPFFTTKEGGTGLGLPIVKSIIESHGGTIELSNAEEGGARVEVTLPLAVEYMNSKAESEAREALPGEAGSKPAPEKKG